jgi:hypothetical protein
MNCAQARPLLLAGDAAAEAHLEGCAACADWLETHDPVVAMFKAARPEALPAPAGLRWGVLRDWTERRRRWAVPAGLMVATLLLLTAAAAAVLATQSGPVAAAADRFTPVLTVLAGQRDVLLSNLPGLAGLAGLAVFSLALAGALYRELGRTPRQLAR